MDPLELVVDVTAEDIAKAALELGPDNHSGARLRCCPYPKVDLHIPEEN